MDVSTLIGLLLGVGLLGGALAVGGELSAYLSLSSFLIVVGGTLAATVVATPASMLGSLPRMLWAVLRSREPDPIETVHTVVRFAETARREGLLAMEDAAAELEDPFLRKGLLLVVDGADPEVIQKVLRIEIEAATERHAAGQRVIQTMAHLAPAFGMIGTLIGLIRMLGHLDEPDQIGPGLAVALITTFYGALLAYLVFQPVATKLKTRSERELLVREMMVEGVLAIQAGENPRLVAEKLAAFLRAEDQQAVRAAVRRPAAEGEATQRALEA